MKEDAMEANVPSSSAPQEQKLDFKTIRRIHEKSVHISRQTLPEHKGILSRLRNRDLTHKRRGLAREITLHNVVGELKHRNELGKAIQEGEIDPLTQIYTLRGFNRRLVEEKGRIEREMEKINQGNEGHPDSILIYFDANGLKKVNDGEGGHAAGNEYLIKIALALSEVARPTDVVARIGGDEFALLLPTATLYDARMFWEERLLPYLVSSGLSVSAGAVPFDPQNIDGSKKNADQQMYKAKRVSKIDGANHYKAYGGRVY